MSNYQILPEDILGFAVQSWTPDGRVRLAMGFASREAAQAWIQTECEAAKEETREVHPKQ